MRSLAAGERGGGGDVERGRGEEGYFVMVCGLFEGKGLLPTIKGPNMPPILAMEFMRATPVAAAGPLRKVAGSAEIIPAGPHNTVAARSDTKAALGCLSISADMKLSAIVATTKGKVAWYRRSPVMVH